MDSIPTDSRTRSSGTSSGLPATDACVIRPGCSINDSTPPSDSASVNSLARSHTSSAAASPPVDPERHHPAEPAHLLRRDLVARVVGETRVATSADARVPEQAARRRARRCRSAGPSAPPASSAPRSVRHASNGPAHRTHRVLVERELLGQLSVDAPRALRRRRRSARRRTSWSSARPTSAPSASGCCR